MAVNRAWSDGVLFAPVDFPNRIRVKRHVSPGAGVLPARDAAIVPFHPLMRAVDIDGIETSGTGQALVIGAPGNGRKGLKRGVY